MAVERQACASVTRKSQIGRSSPNPQTSDRHHPRSVSFITPAGQAKVFTRLSFSSSSRPSSLSKDIATADADEFSSEAESEMSVGMERPVRRRDESPDGYEMRGRYWEAMDVLNLDMSRAPKDCVCDSVYLPPSGLLKTEAMKKLSTLPIRRAWKRRIECQAADTQQPSIVEAIMVYERGEVEKPNEGCSRCKSGEGPAPDCVTVVGIGSGACSNCLYDSVPQSCDAAASPNNNRYSPERRLISAAMPPTTKRKDLIAVWNLVAAVLAQSLEPAGDVMDDSPEARARRIEDAALLVARSADEWGHSTESQDQARSQAIQGVKSLAAQDIRKTALEIARCSREWGAKLEKMKRKKEALEAQKQ
jgi:hypothetical protein